MTLYLWLALLLPAGVVMMAVAFTMHDIFGGYDDPLAFLGLLGAGAVLMGFIAAMASLPLSLPAVALAVAVPFFCHWINQRSARRHAQIHPAGEEQQR